MVIAPARFCIGCGYPIGRGIGVDACPECGVTEVKSAAEWGRCGGEAAAMERLMRAAPLIVSLWVFGTAGQWSLNACGFFAPFSPAWEILVHGWLAVMLVTSVIGAIALWRINGVGPFGNPVARSIWIRAGVLVWSGLSAISAIAVLWPEFVYAMIWHLGIGVPTVAAEILPWCLSMPLPLFVATQLMIAPASLPFWRRQARWMRRSSVLLAWVLVSTIFMFGVIVATWDRNSFPWDGTLAGALFQAYLTAYPLAVCLLTAVVAATSVAYLRRVAAIDASPRPAAELLRWSAVHRALWGGLLLGGAFAITIMIRIHFVMPSMADGFIFVGLALMVMVLWVVAQFVPVLIMRRASRVASQRNARV